MRFVDVNVVQNLGNAVDASCRFKCRNDAEGIDSLIRISQGDKSLVVSDFDIHAKSLTGKEYVFPLASTTLCALLHRCDSIPAAR